MADTLVRPNSAHVLAVVNPTGIPEEGDTGNPSAHLSLDADGNLRTSAVAVIGGSVEISNDVGNPVPVNGTVEITNDVGNPIPVNGTVTANAGVGPWPVTDNGGSLTVDGPLTDTELRASAVPISAASLHLPTGAATAALQTQPGVDIGDVTVNNGGGAAAVNIQDGGNSITVDGTITASGTVSSTPNRPSQGAGRTHVNTTISAAATDQTLYTVTPGKAFYLTTLILSAFNSSTVAVGVIILKDGGAGGTAKLSYLMQQAGVGALVATQPLVPGNNTFLEPLQFTTDVFMDITSGTVVYSVGIVGYEE